MKNKLIFLIFVLFLLNLFTVNASALKGYNCSDDKNDYSIGNEMLMLDKNNGSATISYDGRVPECCGSNAYSISSGSFTSTGDGYLEVAQGVEAIMLYVFESDYSHNVSFYTCWNVSFSAPDEEVSLRLLSSESTTEMLVEVKGTASAVLVAQNNAVKDDTSTNITNESETCLNLKYDSANNQYDIYLNNTLVADDFGTLTDEGFIDTLKFYIHNAQSRFLYFLLKNSTDDCPQPSLPTINLDLKLINEERIVFPSISEDDNFFIFSNYTLGGTPITDANCNFTAINISSHFSTNGTDFLLENSESQLSLIVNDDNNSLLFDFYEFSVCRDSVKTPVQVLLNGIEIDEINENIIPLCSMGNHTELQNITSHNNVNVINFTVICDECNGGNKQITILENTDGNLLHYERIFFEHTENLTYNVTSTLYEFTNHLYHFNYFNVLNGNITLICDDKINSSLTSISQVNLSIDIISINDVEFTSGINIESTETTEILIEISGDFVSSLQFNVTYVNGTLVKSISSEFMNLTFEDLNVDGIYNISIFAIDDDNTIVILEDFFILNDTINPTILWNMPLKDNLTTFNFNTNMTSNITFSDLNLFGYNVTFNFPNGTIHSSFQALNLAVQSIIFSENIELLVSGEWIVNSTVVDEHTSKKINDYDIKKTDNSLTFDSIKVNCINAIGTDYTKLNDKYMFSCEFMKAHSNRKIIIIESNNYLYPIVESGYIAHFVDWIDKKWIDFEGVNKNPKIIKINDTAYQIEFYTEDSKIIFNTIGNLNIVTEIVTFNVIIPPEVFEPIGLLEFDLTVQTNVLILFILIFLYLGVMYLGFAFNNFAFSSMGFFIGIVIGFLLASLSGWLMLVMIMLNILVFYNIAKMKR